MGFFKPTYKISVASVGMVLYWFVDQIFGQLATDYFFEFIPEEKRGMIPLTILILGGFGIVFVLGQNSHSFSRPITKFKKFLKRKIKEGEKLDKSNLLDIPKKKNSEGVLDHSDIETFRKRYQKWKIEVCNGINIAFDSNIDRIKGFIRFDAKISTSIIFFGGFRESLKNDIRYLEEMMLEVKSPWFSEKFSPEHLDEY